MELIKFSDKYRDLPVKGIAARKVVQLNGPLQACIFALCFFLS